MAGRLSRRERTKSRNRPGPRTKYRGLEVLPTSSICVLIRRCFIILASNIFSSTSSLTNSLLHRPPNSSNFPNSSNSALVWPLFVFRHHLADVVPAQCSFSFRQTTRADEKPGLSSPLIPHTLAWSGKWPWRFFVLCARRHQDPHRHLHIPSHTCPLSCPQSTGSHLPNPAESGLRPLLPRVTTPPFRGRACILCVCFCVIDFLVLLSLFVPILLLSPAASVLHISAPLDLTPSHPLRPIGKENCLPPASVLVLHPTGCLRPGLVLYSCFVFLFFCDYRLSNASASLCLFVLLCSCFLCSLLCSSLCYSELPKLPI